MKNRVKKVISLVLALFSMSIIARGGHGGHGGGHRGGGHHAQHGGHHGGHGYHGGGREFGYRGRGAGLLATGIVGAALVNGAFVYNGYPIEYWQTQTQDPNYSSAMAAYQQYQTNPSSVPIKDIEEDNENFE